MKSLIKKLLRESLSNTSLPSINLKKVYHVGSMDINRKSSSSHEGSGLSVSVNPNEWQKINPRTSGDLFELTKENGLFCDKHKLNKTHKETIIGWGVKQQYVTKQVTFRYYYYDDDLDSEVFQEFPTIELAKQEADEDGDIRPHKQGLQPTQKLEQTTQQSKIDTSSTFDYLLTVYVEQMTDLDGIWWNDKLDVSKYSAPRGVVFNNKIQTWNITKK